MGGQEYKGSIVVQVAEALDGTADLFIALRRCDSGAEPVPQILPGCEGLDGQECPSYKTHVHHTESATSR